MDRVTNVDLAASAIRRAYRWLMGAKRALEDKRWDDVVYSAQMAVEQSSKAVLIALGIDFPKEHDVSPAFKLLYMKVSLPNWFKEVLEGLITNISELAELRGLAGYGYEKGLDSDYFMHYAPQTYERAKTHYGYCSRLLKELYEVNVPTS